MEMMGKGSHHRKFKQIDSALAKLHNKKRLPVGKNFAMALNSDGAIADGYCWSEFQTVQGFLRR